MKTINHHLKKWRDHSFNCVFILHLDKKKKKKESNFK